MPAIGVTVLAGGATSRRGAGSWPCRQPSSRRGRCLIEPQSSTSSGMVSSGIRSAGDALVGRRGAVMGSSESASTSPRTRARMSSTGMLTLSIKRFGGQRCAPSRRARPRTRQVRTESHKTRTLSAAIAVRLADESQSGHLTWLPRSGECEQRPSSMLRTHQCHVLAAGVSPRRRDIRCIPLRPHARVPRLWFALDHPRFRPCAVDVVGAGLAAIVETSPLRP
jgi:hypothetical protein